MSFTPEQRAKSAATLRRKAEERRARQETAGIPDSKPFGGIDTEGPLANCHVGGVLVRDLPVEAQARLLYQQTDEGIAESNVGKSDIRVQITADPLTKSIQHRRDDRRANVEPWETEDPLGDVAKANVAPGMRAKFLSTETMKNRGQRGYEVVKDAHGDPVKVGNLILGQMPEEKAQARNRHYQQKGRNMLAEVTERYLEEGGPAVVADK